MPTTGTRISPTRRAAGVGEYYFSRKLAEVRRLDSPDLRVINLGIGSPDLAPDARVVETLVEAARRSDAHAYQPSRGIPRLRQGVAGLYRDVFGVALDPDREILPLTGSKEGIFHVSLAFVDDGDEVLVPDPGYPAYTSVTRLVGGTVRPYRLHERGPSSIDLDNLASQDLSRVKLMWVNFPHMPTGRVAAPHELEQLVAFARRHRILLVSDNPYAMLAHPSPASLLSIEGAKDVALELGSLSKSHNMAGWRVGWVAGSSECVDLVLRVRSNMDSGTFLPTQLAAATALESRSVWFDALTATYAERRRQVEQIARTLGCTFEPSQAGLFVWAQAPDACADVDGWLDDVLHATKVFITPGSVFGPAGRRHVRLSLCCPLDVLSEAHARIAAWQSHGRQAGARPVTAAVPQPSGPPGRTVAIVGLGLIGGSIAIALRESGFAQRLIGIDASPEHAAIALNRGLVDEIGALEHTLGQADVVVLAVPVDALETLAPAVLDTIGDDTVVIDAGSTKQAICDAIAGHPRRAQFVAAHPIAGTEHSGPAAALSGLFRHKVNIVCDRDRSSGHALAVAQALFDALGLRTVFMAAGDHDRHLAYVSHLSHVTSFVLGQTVLDIESDEKNIFLLAGSGFESTVRLAKSSPAMWAPIFQRNAVPLTKALDEYIAHLQRFRDALTARDADRLRGIMTEANEIRRVLPGAAPDAVRPRETGMAAATHGERGRT